MARILASGVSDVTGRAANGAGTERLRTGRRAADVRDGVAAMGAVARRRVRAEAARLSRHHRPGQLSLEEWQAGLRRQYGREQHFLLENVGSEPVFSDFRVTNPANGRTYRVAIRGTEAGVSFCSCSDFRTNTLGTCKHIEFTLARLARTRGARAALRRGFRPRYSSVALRYGLRREVRFRRGTGCPEALARLAARYFDADGVLRADALGTFHLFLSEAARFGHELRCYDDVLEFVAEARDAERRREVLGRAFSRGIRSSAFAGLIRARLYDYQREGALFAARAGRCLIADEMGLGKTLQAIAAAEMPVTSGSSGCSSCAPHPSSTSGSARSGASRSGRWS